MHCSENSRLQRQQTQLIAIIQGFMLEMDRNSGLQSAQFEVIFDFREIPPNFREIPPNFREIPPNSSGLKFLNSGLQALFSNQLRVWTQSLLLIQGFQLDPIPAQGSSGSSSM